MLFVLVGSSVNEDGGLGAYHCTPGLAGVSALIPCTLSQY
jgi:hypothetical protein